MSTLATKVLNNNATVSQVIYFDRNKIVDGVRVHILKTGVLTDGLLTLNIKVNGVISETVTKTYTQINTLGTHWHGMLSMEFSKPLIIRKLPTVLNNTITLELTMSSHTNSDTVFVSLVHSSDPVTELTHNESADYFPTYGNDAGIDVWNNPYEIELYTLN